jgi:hypothetical protein
MTSHDPATTDAEVLARALGSGYAMVGLSARTWSVDPATGIPTTPVSDAEHRTVRDLIAQQRLDGAQPRWLRCTDGGHEIVAAVIPAATETDDLTEDRTDGPAEDLTEDVTAGLPDEVPTEMVDGIEERRTAAARPDDPAGLAARLADLQARIAGCTEPATEWAVDPLVESRGGLVGGWETVGRDQAARALTGRGVDLDTARGMVTDYLRKTSERVGMPAYQWGLDQGDLDAIAATHHLPTADTTSTDELGNGSDDGLDDGAGWPR